MKENTSLTNLRIPFACGTDDEMLIVADMLKWNTTLTNLSFSIGCYHSCAQLSDVSAVEISKALRLNTTLKSFSFPPFSDFSTLGYESLLLSLQRNTTLLHFEMPGFGIDADFFEFTIPNFDHVCDDLYFALMDVSELGAEYESLWEAR